MSIAVAAKRCPRCKETLSSDSFSKNKSQPDGLHSYCSPCNSAYRKGRYDYAEVAPLGPTKACSNCSTEFGRSFEHFCHNKGTRDGLSSWCRGCLRAGNRRWRDSISWERRLVRLARHRHEKRWPDVPFDLTEEYLARIDVLQEGRCIWFNVPLTYGSKSGPTLVSIDRVENDRGYVSGNIVLACDAANRGRKDRGPEAFEIFVELLRQSLQEK